MSMCNYVCVTNRKLMKDEESFLERIDSITRRGSVGKSDSSAVSGSANVSDSRENSSSRRPAGGSSLPKPSFLILREKDLSEEDYFLLAKKVKEVCDKNASPLFLHTYFQVARKLNCSRLHMPLHKFLAMTEDEKSFFTDIGVSIHSKDEAILAETHGASYVTAGHIFETSCKQGVPARGLAFLSEVCHAVSIPVYAIGGISSENAQECVSHGAAGVCMMSGYFQPMENV